MQELSYFKDLLKQKAQQKLSFQIKNPVLINEDEDLFFEQKKFISDNSRFKVAVCSRRAGKTSAIARKLRKVATGGWEHNAIYIAKTTDACKRIMWNMLLQVLQRYHRKNEYKTNASDLSVYFHKTNSFIWLKGAADSSQILKLLGIKLKFACIDEAQSFPSYLEYLIEQILSPALTDLQGELALTGTPNPTCTGYFYEVSQLASWSQHHWTIEHNTFYLETAKKENPQITCAQDIVMSEATRRGVGLNDAAIQRDFYGVWVKSTELQVYRYTASKQDFLELPDISMEVVLGIDVGFNDHDAIVCLGFNKQDRLCYLLDEYKQNKTDITTLADKIKFFVKKWSPYVCVIDAGALGKKIAFELSNRHQLTLVSAEKQRKSEYIALMNDDLNNSRLKIKKRSLLAQEMQQLCWDPEYFDEGKFIENPDFDNHLCDAALYAWKWAYHYLYKEEAPNNMTFEEKNELGFIEKLQKDRDKQIYGFEW